MKKKLLALAALTLFSQYGYAAIYRYTDENGKTMMTNTLPPEAAKLGYDVIGDNGTVIEHVPPPKTEAELAQDEIEKAKQAALEKEKEAKILEAARQQEQDRVILKSFSSEADIIRSRDEKITSIEVIEEIAIKNVNKLQTKLDELKTKSQQYLQNNQTMPEREANLMRTTEQQLKENQDFLTSKEAEKANIQAKYQQMIERYQFLMKEKQNQGTP